MYKEKIMKVKELKEYLNLYSDEKEIIIKASSGNTWEIREDMLANQILTDEKREVCRLYIK